MKLFVFLIIPLSLLVADAIAVTKIDSPYGIVKNYGLVDAIKKPEYVIQDKMSPSSERRKYKFKDLKFIESTNRIPVKKGIRFGLSFEMKNLPDTKLVRFKLKVTHPEMKRPDGTVTTEELYDRRLPVSKGTTYGGNSYLLKYDYELLPGEWGFEYIYEGKSLFSKKFILYKNN